MHGEARALIRIKEFVNAGRRPLTESPYEVGTEPKKTIDMKQLFICLQRIITTFII